MNAAWLQPDMGTRFTEAGFGPIKLEGLTVHPMLRVPVQPGDSLSVEWLSAASPRVQGLALRLRDPEMKGAKGRGGMLRVGDATSPSIALWMDTAPNPSEIAVVSVRPGAELRVSNHWRMPDGREDEWFQNYGMLIDDLSGGHYLLRCSDGIHPAGPQFDDLVVRVTWRAT